MAEGKWSDSGVTYLLVIFSAARERAAGVDNATSEWKGVCVTAGLMKH